MGKRGEQAAWGIFFFKYKKKTYHITSFSANSTSVTLVTIPKLLPLLHPPFAALPRGTWQQASWPLNCLLRSSCTIP